jgi:hypothetical protein
MGRGYNDGNPEPSGRHWGTYSATTELPNAPSGVHTSALMPGDLAAVNGELYQCTAIAGTGTATWTEVLNAASTLDLVLTGDIIADSLNLTAGATVGTTLAVTGDLAVNTNKFTVAASSGNTVVAGTLGVTGASTLTGAVGVTGALTPTGGIVATSPIRITNIPIGPVAYASLGTNTTPVSGTIYVSELWLPSNKTLVGGAFLNGAAVGTNAAIVALYSAAGALLASSALAGVITSGINSFQEIAFTAPYAVVGPGKYFLAYQTNGTTTRLRTIATATYLNTASATAGVFGTLGAITPPTTTTADTGPIGYVYSSS